MSLQSKQVAHSKPVELESVPRQGLSLPQNVQGLSLGPVMGGRGHKAKINRQTTET